MAEKAIINKLNREKNNVCKILTKSGYEIERASNMTFCINAARKPEYRFIGVAIKEILNSFRFKEQKQRLENWPNPAPRVVSIEIWLKREDGQDFEIFTYENGRWIDRNKKPASFLN